MGVRKRHGSVLLATALALSLLPAATAQAAPNRGPAGAAKPAKISTVTLVTGDRIDVIQQGDKQTPRLRPAKGREHVKFAVTRINGHLNVIPSDALRLLAAGKLDRRLFDVTGLIKLGYDDGHRSNLPLLVQGSTTSGVAAKADDAGGTLTQRLPSLSTVALRQPKQRLGAFWSAMTPGARSLDDGVRKIWLDGKRKTLLDESVGQVGAPAAWKAGYNGTGVRVAVLDTGVDATHPDLRDRIAAKKDFSGSGTTNDTVGHGTHVASTIAGTGAARNGRFKGVAPGSKLLVGKVCRDEGCTESAILAGMEWAAKSGAKVANLSLGGYDTPGLDPLEWAVEGLSEEFGTLFVIAAGNSGSADETISSPASADAALAVGAVDKKDRLAGFSSRGPRVGDGGLKPEIVAPGVNITAANAKDGFLGEPGRKYTTLSGTSMATPHVAGAAAILAQRHRSWNGQQLKSALVGAAKTLPGFGAYAQGAGRLDVAQAIKHAKYATPAAVSAGVAVWPHDDDKPEQQTLTYRNPTGTPVTLALKLSTRGPDGSPTPDGFFAVSADKVTVPAKGKKSVTVTVNPALPGADGLYSAWVTATAGTATKITTPVAINKEVESYNLDVDLTDRTGRPASSYLLVALNLDTGTEYIAFDGDGGHKLRLPKGRYHVFSFLDTKPSAGTDDEISLLTYPEFQHTSDGRLSLDAREAKPIEVTLDRPDAEPIFGAVGYTHRDSEELGIGAEVWSDNFEGVSTLHLGAKLPKDKMVSTITSQRLVPGPDDDFGRSTRTYNLSYVELGRLVTGFTKHEREANLASVTATYHTHGSGKLGAKFWFAQPEGIGWGGSSASAYSMPLPMTRTEFVNTEGVDWSSLLMLESADAYEGELYGALVTDFEPGKTYQQAWNNVVHGPSLSRALVGREKDTLIFAVPMYSDGADHLGFADRVTGTTILYRDGKQIAESEAVGYGEFKVPADDAGYRVKVISTRAGSSYSTKQTAEWTFRSGHTDALQTLPVQAVGFTPKVDRFGRAHDGETQQVPVRVTVQEGQPAVQSLVVEASFDDGATWKKVPVSPADSGGPPASGGVAGGGGYTAEIKHPAGKKFVSLRATATSAGGTVKQTTIRAYGLR
jgi:subtilisin family serine protease